jgi:hypothetical protein
MHQPQLVACLAPKPPAGEARGGIDAERGHGGQRDGRLGQYRAFRQCREVAVDQPGIDLALREPGMLRQRGKEGGIGHVPATCVCFSAVASFASASARVSPWVITLAIIGS